MKKLMIAATVVCAALFAQAYTYDWKVGGIAINDGTGKTSATTMTTVYLFNALDYSQQSLLDDAFGKDGTALTFAQLQAKAVGEATLTKGVNNTYKVTDKAFGSDDGTKSYSYIAVFDEAAKKIFINTTKDQPIDKADGATTHLAANSAYANGSKTTFSVDDSKTFASAGWYTVSAVPEPTSGLLLLLGVAGLALKRKRA